MPGIPPLRVTHIDGDFNQIPVFEMEISGATLTKLDTKKIRIAIEGSQGPSGVPGTVQIGSAVGAGSSHAVLFVNSSSVLWQDADNFYWAEGTARLGLAGSNPGTTLHVFGSATVEEGLNMSDNLIRNVKNPEADQDAVTKTYHFANTAMTTLYPVRINSGGTGITSITSATMLVASNSSDTANLDFMRLAGGDSVTVTRDGTNLLVNAITTDATELQPSISYPLAINSGGTGFTSITSATMLVAANSSDTADLDFMRLAGGDSVTITRDGTNLLVNATTTDATSLQPSITYPLRINSGGTGITSITSATMLVTSNSSDTANLDYMRLAGGDSVTVTRNGTNLLVNAVTSDVSNMVVQGTTLTAGSGLTGGGDLSQDRTFSVNTNVRDKASGFYLAGNILGGIKASSARIYIPFNQEVLHISAAAGVAPTGAAIIAELKSHATPEAAGIIVGSASIAATTFVGTALTFGTGTIYAGSYLGLEISQSGSTLAGSDLTLTLITRSS